MEPFEFSEIIPEEEFDNDSSNLSIQLRSTVKLILFRCLVGSVNIKHVFTNTQFEQRIDYFDVNNRFSNLSPLERLANYISEDITINDLNLVFQNRVFLFQNRDFFKRLNNEFNNYFYHFNKGSHTAAFAYLYRILETISYAFPFIYATKTNDFKGTYSYLKDFINGSRDKGELGFFKTFVKAVFNTDSLFESSIDINIVAETETIQQMFYSAFMKASPDQSLYDSADTIEPRKISVKFSEYSSFIINLRNRFFHLFSSGQPNLQSDDILDSDYFFSLVNKPTATWLSLISLEIFKHSILPLITTSES